MKSDKGQLEKRGFLPQDFDTDSCNLFLDEKLKLLQSSIPTERTLAARLLSKEAVTDKVIEKLIARLALENKLYPKIEISNTLTHYGQATVKHLIKVLGKIGTNQHKVVPEKEFKKDNYPLPRDISSRIIAHIGKTALQELIDNFEKLSIIQLSEAIDAIGFICFYNHCPDTNKLLEKSYKQNSENDLIKWKIIRACSAFPESEGFLQAEKRNLQNKRLLMEIERSISLIRKRN